MNKIDNCPCCGGSAYSMVSARDECVELQIYCIKCGLERRVVKVAKTFEELYSEMVDMIYKWNMRQEVSA